MTGVYALAQLAEPKAKLPCLPTWRCHHDGQHRAAGEERQRGDDEAQGTAMEMGMREPGAEQASDQGGDRQHRESSRPQRVEVRACARQGTSPGGNAVHAMDSDQFALNDVQDPVAARSQPPPRRGTPAN
jgi:hypothetical protein